ncbi:MAG TPA: hypothetical protein VLU92_09220 [Candidatus Dormibacteraeota bacterium]|nr:hypothetical protein [Candidatus Dormibacteraeota bacterium]
MSSRPIEQGRGESLTGVDNNGRLTALTGALLLVLLAGLGLTILSIGELLPQHFLIGFLVIPPLGLKLASTGYRFMRYYSGDARYRQAGPPVPLLRILAPFVVLSTIAVFATGLELWFFGLRFGSIWIEAHKLTFFAWLPITGVHVLAHLNRTGRVAAGEFSSSPFASALTRRSLVVGSLVAGVVLAVVSLTYASPFVFFGDG